MGLPTIPKGSDYEFQIQLFQADGVTVMEVSELAGIRVSVISANCNTVVDKFSHPVAAGYQAFDLDTGNGILILKLQEDKTRLANIGPLVVEWKFEQAEVGYTNDRKNLAGRSAAFAEIIEHSLKSDVDWT